MDWVHKWWTTAGSHGPPWTGGGANRRASGRGGALAEVGPPVTMGNRSSLTVAEIGERSTGVLFWAGDGGEAWRQQRSSFKRAGGCGRGVSYL
jgi:hypothetical protein